MKLNKDGYFKLVEERNCDEKNYTVTVIGEDYGLTAKQMNQILTKLKILGNWGPKDNPYRHIDDNNGGYEIYHYNKRKVNRFDDPDGLKKYTPLFNNRGMHKIKDALFKVGIYPICDLLLCRSYSEYDDSYPSHLGLMVRRRNDLPRSPIYIGYISNLEDKVKFNRDCQPLNESEYNLISKTMSGSKKFKEDSHKNIYYISPRVDDRDPVAYKSVDEILYDKFLNSINIMDEIDKYKKQNLESYKKFMGQSFTKK